MSSSDHEISVPMDVEGDGPPGNTVAAIGLILTVIAGLMCGVLFTTARGLPDSKKPDVAETGRAQPSADRPSADVDDGSDADSGSPRAEQQVEQIHAQQDAQRLRVLLLASTTAMLNLVGLVLSIVGLFVPNRPRMMAVCGTVLSLLLFAGVFGVMAVGAMMNPGSIVSSVPDGGVA